MLKEIVQNEFRDEKYPFNILSFDSLDLSAPVTFLTGANGCGKSTLLHAISHLAGCINLGKASQETFNYEQGFKLAWSNRLKRGYYFQSEDFYSFLTWAKDERATNHSMLDDAEARHSNKTSMGYLLETNLHRSNTKSMDNIVTNYMEASHGEGYIRFFSSRLRANTLYLLDEPETPLSFQNQLTLISLIDEYVKKGSQFIICTHSPILLAYPNATIYYFDDYIKHIQYNDHPLVKEYRMFLDSPERFMHYLINE